MLSILPEATQVILIGASSFPNDSSLCSLPGVTNNVLTLAQLLQNSHLIGIPEPHITTLLDEYSASAVGAKLAEIAKKATDTLIVYYAGHGLVGRSGRCCD